MSTFEAVTLCETLDPTDPEARDAWQHLVDSGLAWRLQGWFGRTAAALISAGIVAPAGGSH